jgi:hypothetical protein
MNFIACSVTWIELALDMFENLGAKKSELLPGGLGRVPRSPVVKIAAA